MKEKFTGLVLVLPREELLEMNQFFEEEITIQKGNRSNCATMDLDKTTADLEGIMPYVNLETKTIKVHGNSINLTSGLECEEGTNLRSHVNPCITSTSIVNKLPKWKRLTRQGLPSNTVPEGSCGDRKRQFEVKSTNSPAT
ncbi:hypothetical protein ACOSQ3_017117 [Xanthoceras sorbifolium]